MADRQACGKCSVPGIAGYNVVVLSGDGNCETCIKTRTSTEAVAWKNLVGAGADDGKNGTGDRDMPYRFGKLPTVDRLGTWSYEQYSKLMELKRRVLDSKIAAHIPHMDGF